MRFTFSRALTAGVVTLFTTIPAVAQQSEAGLYPGVVSALLAPASNASVGAPSYGLAAALDTSPSAVHSGRPIVLSLELRNVSKQLRLVYRPECPENYTFVVTNLRSGRSTMVNGPDCGDLYGSPIQGLNPGESQFLKFKFSGKAFAEPVRYRIRLASVTWYPSSNSAPQKLELGSTAVIVTIRP